MEAQKSLFNKFCYKILLSPLPALRNSKQIKEFAQDCGFWQISGVKIY